MGVTLPLTKWSSERLAHRPLVVVQSRGKRLIWNADFRCPVSHWHRDAVVRKKPQAITSVPSLLGACCPTAVVLFIVAIVIFSLDGVVGTRSFTHVSQEHRERFSPFWADLNPAPAIVRVPGRVAIGAALNQSTPNMIFRMVDASVFVSGASFPDIVLNSVHHVTAAGFGVPGSKRIRSDYRVISARAQAHPQSVAKPVTSSVFKNGEATKRFSDQRIHPVILYSRNRNIKLDFWE